MRSLYSFGQRCILAALVKVGPFNGSALQCPGDCLGLFLTHFWIFSPMEQLIEFIGNHVLLVSAFGISLALLLWSENLKGGKSVSPAETTMLVNKESAVLLDIRAKKDWDTGHITNAIHIPFAELKQRQGELKKHQSKPIVVICNMGQTAGAAVKMLKAEGFENVMRLQGGMTEWKGQNLPIVK